MKIFSWFHQPPDFKVKKNEDKKNMNIQFVHPDDLRFFFLAIIKCVISNVI